MRLAGLRAGAVVVQPRRVAGRGRFPAHPVSRSARRSVRTSCLLVIVAAPPAGSPALAVHAVHDLAPPCPSWQGAALRSCSAGESLNRLSVRPVLISRLISPFATLRSSQETLPRSGTHSTTTHPNRRNCMGCGSHIQKTLGARANQLIIASQLIPVGTGSTGLHSVGKCDTTVKTYDSHSGRRRGPGGASQ